MDYFPKKVDFLKLSKKYNLIPVYREILGDLETPVSAFLKIADKPFSYLLESVEGGEKIARFSFVAADPSLIFKSKGREISLTNAKDETKIFKTDHDPLYELEKIMKRYRQAPVSGLPPFSGGAVGYMGYDTVRFIEKIPDKNKDILNIPESLFIFTDTILIFDHLNKKIKVVSNVFLDNFNNPEEAYAHAQEKIDQEIKRLNAFKDHRTSVKKLSKCKIEIKSNFTKTEFEKAVLKAKHHIKDGDIFQGVLSQRFRTPVESDSFDIYRALRSVNPSPYMFYFDCGDFELVGASPEMHVRCEGAVASLRPIAGTRKRGNTAKDDERLSKELLQDPKERAEHVMLVDLGRNDLGRVCEYGSVTVPEFMVIEKYSHVMHIVSHVQGKMQKNKTLYDLLRATFPAGTISGSPKVRAMQIIDNLENERRSFYAGVVGYFSYSGNLDSCIAIRTIVVKNGVAYVQAGAGIVADSDPKKEYEETVNKAKALMKAIEIAENGESQ